MAYLIEKGTRIVHHAEDGTTDEERIIVTVSGNDGKSGIITSNTHSGKPI